MTPTVSDGADGTVLVTGGAGYIGSHTVVALQQAGYNVHVVDDLRRSSANALQRVTSITGTEPGWSRVDINDTEALVAIFGGLGPISAVVHFAAYKSVRESVADPLSYYANNVSGTVSLLQAMQQCNVAHLVFSSSCTVYGQPDTLPVTEETPLGLAASPYGATKQMCERVIADQAAAGTLASGIMLRYFNPAGAHDSALIGELPIGEPENLVPYVVQTAAGQRAELRVFGGDYDTVDGTAVRDYLHVQDVAEAHVSAVALAVNATHRLRAYNLGMGKGHTVLQAVEAFERSTGTKVPHRIVERRPGDVAKIYSSCQRAADELGWSAKRSLDDIMATAWAWQQTLPAAGVD